MTGYPELHHPTAGVDAPPVLLLHGGNVANWMWAPQVAALDDRLVLTPDLPGFGSRADQTWPGLPAVVDFLEEQLTASKISTAVDVVGLSLGGLVALHLAARRPQLIRSLMISGVMTKPPGAAVMAAARLQLLLWDRRWFWKVQAAGFRIPPEAHSTYVEHGLSVSRTTARRMFENVMAGGLPPGLADLTAPVLAVAGEREPSSIRASLGLLREVVPQTEIRLVPGMHHVWSVEDVELFNQTMRHWLAREVHPKLLPV